MRNLCACRRAGVLSIRRGVFLLMTALLLTKMMCAVILWVNRTLRAMMTTATFLLVSRCTIPRILLASLGLSVSAGLLKKRTLGPRYSVCVTSVCRRRLLESR